MSVNTFLKAQNLKDTPKGSDLTTDRNVNKILEDEIQIDWC